MSTVFHTDTLKHTHTHTHTHTTQHTNNTRTHTLSRLSLDHQAAYREAFEELKVLKSEVEYLTKLTEQSRAKLVLEYDAWYKVRAVSRQVQRSEAKCYVQSLMR